MVPGDSIVMTNQYMDRCFQLARLAIGKTLTNPLVGAVIVYENRIIGEGYHESYGTHHAEIVALHSVKPGDYHFLASSTLYVNLEPCSHHGKTPPCADEIIRVGIPKVVIGSVDPNPEVNGKGIQKLRRAGVEVIILDDQKPAEDLNRIFFKNMKARLPYVILKFACSQDNYIGNLARPVSISNDWSRYLVHKIRNTVDAILIGTNTAITDNPMLTNRLYYGKHPIRIVLDRKGRIPKSYNILKDKNRTWLFTESDPIGYDEEVRIIPWINDLKEMLRWLLAQGIGSILIEGGAQTLQSFISQSLWDEAWITRGNLMLSEGIKAPEINGRLTHNFDFNDDMLALYRPV
ncbi:MAG: bifunctional diaminohydroxyphosphoribosylaminopyrimidine deaminase/5-amino-6-(5-phosphoribosylamino)uracil reductase RibD [Saprospiraceae bacterium]